MVNPLLSDDLNGEINIFTDGSFNSLKRKTTIGWSFVVEYDENIVHTQHGSLKIGKKKKKYGILYSESTAIINAVKYVLAKSFTSAVIFSDSLYCVHAIRRPCVDWKNPVILGFINKLQPYLQQANKLGIKINILYCKSHHEIEGNNLADELAKCGRKKRKDFHLNVRKYVE